MDEKKTPELDLSGADPKLPFYITGCLNPDGSIDISSEGKDPLAFDVAVENAKDMIDNYGDDAIYVIECRAVRKIYRGKVRVEQVKTKAAR